MPKNVELVQQMFGSEEPLPSIELAYNALKLGGIAANLYALKTDLNGQVNILLGNIQDVIDELEEHKDDDVRHLTQGQINKINDAINAAQALQIANQAINTAKAAIIAEAVDTATDQAEDYTDSKVSSLNATLTATINALSSVVNGKQNQLTFDTSPTSGSSNPVTSNGIYQALKNKIDEEEYTDPISGETTTQSLPKALIENPQTRVNPECFYRFKNMVENSSFEVFDGTTGIPLGWDNGEVSADAAMFGTYSLKLVPGEIAKQTSKFQCDVSWLKDAYETNDVVLCFYHKFNAIDVKIYDVENEEYMTLTPLDSELQEGTSGTTLTFDYRANWNQYRDMIKFTPKINTKKVQLVFIGKSGTKSASYIDAPSMEPYVAGEYPSIYKDGRYSVSAYQILNPPPGDVDRFTALEHLDIDPTGTIVDENGNITQQKLVRGDGSLAIMRVATNKDQASGQYTTITEIFYKADGITENYRDIYTYTYSSTGAITSRNRETTEVV